MIESTFFEKALAYLFDLPPSLAFPRSAID